VVFAFGPLRLLKLGEFVPCVLAATIGREGPWKGRNGHHVKLVKIHRHVASMKASWFGTGGKFCTFAGRDRAKEEDREATSLPAELGDAEPVVGWIRR
jgi:hypothetical protein